MGLTEAGHTESDPQAIIPLLTLAACPVEGRDAGSPRLTGKLKVSLTPDSLAYAVYQQDEVSEAFNCNYELNPDYRGVMEMSGIVVSGVSPDGGARIIELPNAAHPFYLATGFLPQLSSSPGKPHPVVTALLQNALGFHEQYNH